MKDSTNDLSVDELKVQEKLFLFQTYGGSTEEMSFGFFSNDNGFDDKEREKIESLKIGESFVGGINDYIVKRVEPEHNYDLIGVSLFKENKEEKHEEGFSESMRKDIEELKKDGVLDTDQRFTVVDILNEWIKDKNQLIAEKSALGLSIKKAITSEISKVEEIVQLLS